MKPFPSKYDTHATPFSVQTPELSLSVQKSKFCKLGREKSCGAGLLKKHLLGGTDGNWRRQGGGLLRLVVMLGSWLEARGKKEKLSPVLLGGATIILTLIWWLIIVHARNIILGDVKFYKFLASLYQPSVIMGLGVVFSYMYKMYFDHIGPPLSSPVSSPLPLMCSSSSPVFPSHS